MTEDPDAATVVAESGRHPGESFDNEDYERVKSAVHEGTLGAALTGPSVLVVGSYDDPERERLERVRDRIGEHRTALLMDEVEEVWEYWTTKFKLLVANVELVVGVYEHSDGGHEWEAGYLDARERRARTVVLKRSYPGIEDPADEPFDAMMAHWMATMRHLDRVYDWSLAETGPSLAEATGHVIEAHLEY
ncbi:MAG: hypothetical protein ABEJ89_08645 [Haloarculaceae archaeon]